MNGVQITILVGVLIVILGTLVTCWLEARKNTKGLSFRYEGTVDDEGNVKYVKFLGVDEVSDETKS